MAEDHSHHHDVEDVDGLTEKEKAAMRWQAIQGFNAAPIPPLAARLGIALICHMDPKKRLCYVGELRLSIELGAHIFSIQKAKKQLKTAGLIDWSNPGGPRHLSHYSFFWETLLHYSRQANDAAKAAIEKARQDRRNHSHKAAMELPVKTSRKAGLKTLQKSTISNSVPAKSHFYSSQIKFQNSQAAAPIPAVGLADITVDIIHKDIAGDHAIAGNGGRATTPLFDRLNNWQQTLQEAHTSTTHYEALTGNGADCYQATPD